MVFAELERWRRRAAETYFLYVEQARRRQREGIGEKQRARRLISPVLLGLLAGCGPSYRVLHESHVHFERCYAMDDDASVAMWAKAECWRTYERAYSVENADRGRYAHTRVRTLQALATHPTDESLMSAAPGSSDVHVTAPTPDTASGPPPMMGDGSTVKRPTAK